MRHQYLKTLALAFCVLLPCCYAQAQQRGQMPAVGSELPAVTLFNEAGEQFSTNSLRGQYSVLIFGCLT